MKPIQALLAMLLAGLIVSVGQPVLGALYTFSGPDGNGTYSSGTISPDQLIADNSEVGVGYGFDFTATGLTVSEVSLSINLSGGYNGDMYGYLQHSGTLIELFNPSTFSVDGAGGSTINITLSSGVYPALSGATAAQLGQGGLTYAASGNLDGFVGADPGGLWTLYFEDQSAGDQMTLNSFSLAITAVPEPTHIAVGIFGGIFAVAGLLRRCFQRK